MERRRKTKEARGKGGRIPETSTASWREHAWPLAALALLALLAYSNSFRDGFAWDNAAIILRDTRIRQATAQNAHLIWTQEYWYNITTTGLYRPITTFSFLLNYAILGNSERPAGYHWVNFGLHTANLVLVYFLGLLVLKEKTPALALAAVWALHPVLTESVTNIVGRADLLAGFAVLAGLLCYVRSTRTEGWRKTLWLTALALETAVGMFSKESAVVVVAVVALYDLAWGTAAVRDRIPGYLAIAAPLAVFFSVRGQTLSNLPLGRVPFGDNPLLGADFPTAQLAAVKVIGKYLWLLLWPGRLSCDYSFNQVPLAVDWKSLAALAVCLAAAVFAVRSFRRNRAVFFFIAFFFVTLAPTSNVFLLIGTIMAERFLYLPAIAFAGCLVMTVYAACRRLRSPRAAPVLLGLICAALAARTWARNLDWFDDLTLLASAERAAPASFKVHTMLADRWQEKAGGLDRAIAEIGQALAILDPLPDEQNSVRPYAIAGQCYRRKGDAVAPGPQSHSWYQRAVAALERAARIDRAGLEAIRRENEAHGRRVYPSGWAPVYLELGRAYGRLSQPRKAVEALEYGLALRPAPEFFNELAAAYRAAGDSRHAAIALIEGLALNPGNPEFASELVGLYQETEPQSCALRGAAPNLECPLVHDEVCEASRAAALLYRKMGRAALGDSTAASAIRDLGCPAGMFQ